MAPPPVCPGCHTQVAADARFCSSCGAKLVGARPAEAQPPAPSAPVAAAPKAAPLAASAQAARELEDARRALPAARPSSNIGTNVLVFVAFLCALVVLIYVMNKDAPKEATMFSGAPPSPPAATAEAPAAAAPVAAAPAAPAPAGAAGGGLWGRLVVVRGLGVGGVGTVCVMVRNAGAGRGPPVAAKRLEARSFPVDFSVSAADVMMPGMPFTGPFDIQVRLDRDGDAMTKAPGDLENGTPASGVKPGDSGVRVVLDKRL